MINIYSSDLANSTPALTNKNDCDVNICEYDYVIYLKHLYNCKIYLCHNVRVI